MTLKNHCASFLTIFVLKTLWVNLLESLCLSFAVARSKIWEIWVTFQGAYLISPTMVPPEPIKNRLQNKNLSCEKKDKIRQLTGVKDRGTKGLYPKHSEPR